MMQLLAARCGQLLNIASLANELDVDAKTVSNWLSILQSSFILFLLNPYYENFNKRVTKTPKVYFYDTGLVCSLLQINTAEMLETHPAKGHLFENYVLLEFIKNNENWGKNQHYYFWAENNGNEVDLVIPAANELHTFEIKSANSYKPEFAKQLDKLAKYANKKTTKTVIYNGDLEFEDMNGLNVINFSKSLVIELSGAKPK